MQGRHVVVAWVLVAAALCACARDDAPSTTPPPEPAPAKAKVAREHAAPRDPRLREDCGGWEPSGDLLDAATNLDGLDAMTPSRRVEVLRAGLRLLDDASARACAARVEWTWIDRWECARCVDLLTDDVLRHGTDATYEQFRSYQGSCELTRFLRALPPTLPWTIDPVRVLADTHRIARIADMPAYLDLTKRKDAAVVDEAWGEIDLLGRWNDEFREDVARREVDAGDGAVAKTAPEDGSRLPPVLAAWLRMSFLKRSEGGDDPDRVWNEKLRWCWESTPGPADAELLMALAEHGKTDWQHVAGVAYVLLGKLHDPTTDAFLRRKAADEQLARWALARRGDAEMLAAVVADATANEEFALELVMEVDPPRARKLIDEVLLGTDDEAAGGMLDEFALAMTPGAYLEPLGFDWRRTSLDGLGAAAIDAKIPAWRLARTGIVVPSYGTRALAVAAAGRLRPGDLKDDVAVAGFLETDAPAEFAASLRAVRAAGGDDAALATKWLVKTADRATCDAVAASGELGGASLIDLARSHGVEVRRLLESRVHAVEASSEDGDGAIYALAVWHGLPEAAANAFDVVAPGVAAAALDGRPVDALALVLAAKPDETHGDVGAVNDPRVRAYLVRLRERRELGHYWYATGQLAAMGDADARAEFWGAMHDGRYRIVNEADYFDRTLGWDVAATMPFWIDELRSQCCRIVTGGGDLVGNFLDIDCFSSEFRTSYRRAKELWDAAGGRFIKSRIADRWVPAPR
jgi:hypothetical protein